MDLSECSIIVTRKGGSINKVYFSDEAAEYLKDYMQEKERNLPLYNRPGDPLIISEKSVEQAYLALKDKDGPRGQEVIVPVELITKDNVDQFGTDGWQ